MRLYLSSRRLGERAGALLALAGTRARAAVIANGLDGLPADAHHLRRDLGDEPVSELAALGITGTNLDLRDFFDRKEALSKELMGYDLVWVTGGNAFTLRRAMKQSGFDEVISAMLDRDEIVYGGCAAGAVVAGPTLYGYEIVDDPGELPVGYRNDAVGDGLGLIDFTVIPHYGSSRPAAVAAERYGRSLARRGLPFRALRDGEAIVWTGVRASATGDLRRIA